MNSKTTKRVEVWTGYTGDTADDYVEDGDYLKVADVEAVLKAERETWRTGVTTQTSEGAIDAISLIAAALGLKIDQ